MRNQAVHHQLAGGPSRAYAVQWWDVFAFVIPSLVFVEVEVVGRVFLTDLLLLAVLPFLLLFRGVAPLRRRVPLTFLGLWLLWLIGLVGSDLYVDTPSHDLARGWAKVVLMGLHFITLYLLLDGRPRRVVLFALGLVVGWILVYFTSAHPSAVHQPWKFGYGPAVTWLLVLAACILGTQRAWVVAILTLAGGLNFLFGFRSLGGVCFVSAAFIVVTAFWRPSMTIRLWRTGAVIALLALFGWGVYQGYQMLAGAGLLGERALLHNMRQSGGDFGLLFGGRSEVLVAARAISDSPIIGHGSWARDCRYAEMLVPLLSEFGYSAYHYDPYENCLIPTHSHLTGAWTEAGITGGFFWFWVLGFIAVVLQHNLSASNRLTPLVVFVAFVLVWDVLFSPFGGERRFINPFLISLLIFSLEWARSGWEAGNRPPSAAVPGAR